MSDYDKVFGNSGYDNRIPPVGYTEVKRKIKILKTVAIILTVLTCLSSIPLGLLGIGVAPDLETDFFGPLFSVGTVILGVVLLISCGISVAVIWILYAILKKRIEQGKSVLPVVVAIAVAWIVPRVLSAVFSLITALVENNLEFIM